MEEDAHFPINFRTPLLATYGAIIDMKNGKIFVYVGQEKLEVNLAHVTVSFMLPDFYYRVNILDKVVMHEMEILAFPIVPLGACLIV